MDGAATADMVAGAVTGIGIAVHGVEVTTGTTSGILGMEAMAVTGGVDGVSASGDSTPWRTASATTATTIPTTWVDTEGTAVTRHPFIPTAITISL